MSNDIKTLLDTEIYPQLYQSLEHALPEFNFKKKGRSYISTSGHKITGGEGKKGKVYVYQNNPSHLIDYTRGNQSIWDYIQERDRLTNGDTLQKLAQLSGVVLPKLEHSPELLEKIKKQNRLSQIWEDLNSYFVYLLIESKDGGAQRDNVLKYLQSRGYSVEDVKEMGLGYIPSRDRIIKYLTGTKGYPEDELQDVFKLTSKAGDNYRLSIPFRDPVGRIKGMIVRTIEPGIEPKYLYTTGLKKGELLLNLQAVRGDRDLILVEGQLDALIGGARGVENIAAIGGANITDGQVELCKKYGAQKITLFLDNDKAGREATLRAIDKLQGHFKTYVAIYPPEAKEGTDPDQLVKEMGIEVFKRGVDRAWEGYRYKIQAIWNKYQAIGEAQDGELFPKQKEELLEEIVSWGQTLEEPLDRAQYTKLFLSFAPVKNMGITEEALSSTVDKIRYNQEKEKQKIELSKLLLEAKGYQDKGEIDKALELLDSKVKEVKLKDKITEFSSLLLPLKEDEIRERQANKPESLNSGYTIGGEPLLLPSGAISILAAPTSHGKTTFLINMAINTATAYPTKEIHLFSYEEDRDSMLINTLNPYLDEDISINNRKTIRNYFTTGSVDFVKKEAREYFIATKDKFFRELIEPRRLNIHYSSYDSDTLIEAIRYLHKHSKPGAIFIDYIQLLNLPEGKYKTYSRQEEIKEICIALKDVAVETGLPIILGSQFNRTVTNQLQLHPTKIGEAGDIERIANLIVGFWNNNFKPIATEGELKEIIEKRATTQNTIYTTILKNRGGRVGLEEILSFKGNTGRIKNGFLSDNSYF